MSHIIQLTLQRDLTCRQGYYDVILRLSMPALPPPGILMVSKAIFKPLHCWVSVVLQVNMCFTLICHMICFSVKVGAVCGVESLM